MILIQIDYIIDSRPKFLAVYSPGEQSQTIAREALPHLNGAAVSCRAVLSDFTVVGCIHIIYTRYIITVEYRQQPPPPPPPTALTHT